MNDWFVSSYGKIHFKITTNALSIKIKFQQEKNQIVNKYFIHELNILHSVQLCRTGEK